ncbi:MAG TPA: methyltransferase domain-containing protein [Steroidobacteraceae bacterium]|nr:methyltransferase domain-containing protein [Steroidobacteraceae bacterium]
MTTSTLRYLAAVTMLAAAASLAAFASEAPTEAPPKPYEIPTKGIKDYIRKAVQSPDRPKAMTDHDFYRKPAEILALSDVRPGSKVIELSSYGNYYSTMLSSVIGPKGKLYMYDMPFFGDQVKKDEQDFIAKHPNAVYENVDFNKVEFPKNIDVVTCMSCFHELMLTGVDLSPFLSKIYKSLRPGGTFIIIFYTARDATDTDAVGPLHRIDPSVVRGELGAAGFALYEEDRYLQNSSDDKTWLVDTEAQGDIADRTVYKFRKSDLGGG